MIVSFVRQMTVSDELECGSGHCVSVTEGEGGEDESDSALASTVQYFLHPHVVHTYTK